MPIWFLSPENSSNHHFSRQIKPTGAKILQNKILELEGKKISKKKRFD